MKKLIERLVKMFSKKTPYNYEALFVRLKPLFPKISEKQKEGVVTLLNAMTNLPLKQKAYILATVYHETAKTMQPITEYGGVKYFDKYDTGSLAAALGNTPQKDGDGYRYRGRGYVMITGHSNYYKASQKLGVDFVNSPDLALDPKHSANILIQGMLEGWFTTRKLGSYVNESASDYYNARRVVNGVDDASLIKKYADTFEQVL